MWPRQQVNLEAAKINLSNTRSPGERLMCGRNRASWQQADATKEVARLGKAAVYRSRIWRAAIAILARQ